MVKKKGGPIVVMFYNQLCPFCALMMPHFEKYAEEFKGKITSQESMLIKILTLKKDTGS